MATFRVLVVDDDEDLLQVTGDVLSAAGYDVMRATNGDDAIATIKAEHVDAMVLDMMLGKDSGLEVMAMVKKISPLTEIIIATGYATVETAVQAMSRGAFQYLSKPVNMPELLLLMERATRKARDAFDKEMLVERLRRQNQQVSDDGMVVASPIMQDLLEEISDMAFLDKPMFISGETGSGKEVIAHFIHEHSQRKDGPFNTINCATLTESLVDAELFGYEKGAFTGAEKARPGIIAASHDGTLFLDEIGDISLAAQARLLRFLESGVVRPVGSDRERKYDVRIIAATHKDLSQEISDGNFREDLYHRLVVFDIELPPLRKRPEDIRPLVEHFLHSFPNSDVHSIDDEAVTLLQQQAWTGNIRELRNETERAWLRARRRGGDSLISKDYRLSSDAPNSPDEFSGYGPIPLQQAELLHVRHVLSLSGNNKRKAAKMLGISERHIYRLLQASEELDSEQAEEELSN